MEEWVGGLWHRFITAKADNCYPSAMVEFTEVAKSVGAVFRALGGDAVKRIEAASKRDYIVRRSLLQKISGTNQQVSLAWQDEESLRLPESLAVFETTELNRDLYIWLAVLGAYHNQYYGGKFSHWANDNQAMVGAVLKQYPAMVGRYNRLANAFAQSRNDYSKRPFEEQQMEKAIIEAVLKPGSVVDFPAVNYAPAPVCLWLYPSAHVNPQLLPDYEQNKEQNEQSGDDDEQTKKPQKKSSSSRKEAERVAAPNERDGMMIFRLESLFSWSEFAQLDRGSDDSDDDEDNQKIAEDLDKITLSQQQNLKSGNIKIDLDLPSASIDDIALGDGIKLPEWDYKKQQLQADRCLLQPMLPRDCFAQKLPARLQNTARTIQAQFEKMQTQRHWQKAQPQGEELDLSAWLDFHVQSTVSATAEKGLYQTFRANNRDLSCLLLADLSMSTESYVDDDTQVIDIVKDSLLLFGEALQAVGDEFAMYGFSSVKKEHVRFTLLKNFKERYDDKIRGRIQAIKPGFYTRMGAAIRQASKVLCEQRSAQKLLLILTDGKPNDIDHYEGRFGIEDTHQAIAEANRMGLKPFCITIDQDAQEYLPYLFGHSGFTVIKHSRQLPVRLPQLYHQLTSH